MHAAAVCACRPTPARLPDQASHCRFVNPQVVLSLGNDALVPLGQIPGIVSTMIRGERAHQTKLLAQRRGYEVSDHVAVLSSAMARVCSLVVLRKPVNVFRQGPSPSPRAITRPSVWASAL